MAANPYYSLDGDRRDRAVRLAASAGRSGMLHFVKHHLEDKELGKRFVIGDELNLKYFECVLSEWLHYVDGTPSGYSQMRRLYGE